MVSLTDESFQSLPVPSYIRKLLMLNDVADDLLEAYQMSSGLRLYEGIDGTLSVGYCPISLI